MKNVMHQSLFGLFAASNVLKLTNEVERLAVRISDQRHGQEDPNAVAKLMKVALLYLTRRKRAVKQLIPLHQDVAKIIGMSDVLESQGQQLVA